MSAISGTLVPDIISTSQTWVVKDIPEYEKLLDGIIKQMYFGTWLLYADRNDEWSGPGVYRLQIRLNRPEGLPLYSLKWEGPA